MRLLGCGCSWVAEDGGWPRIRDTNHRNGFRKHCKKWCRVCGGDGGIEYWKHRLSIRRIVVLYITTAVHCYVSTIIARTGERPKVMRATHQLWSSWYEMLYWNWSEYGYSLSILRYERIRLLFFNNEIQKSDSLFRTTPLDEFLRSFELGTRNTPT